MLVGWCNRISVTLTFSLFRRFYALGVAFWFSGQTGGLLFKSHYAMVSFFSVELTPNPSRTRGLFLALILLLAMWRAVFNECTEPMDRYMPLLPLVPLVLAKWQVACSSEVFNQQH